MKGKVSNPNFMKNPKAPGGGVGVQLGGAGKQLEAALTRAKQNGVLTLTDR